MSCAPSEHTAATTAAASVVRDSAGIRIVANTRPLAGGSGEWARVEPDVSLEIGVVQGPAPYTFSAIQTAVQAANGEIVVVDWETQEIRVFDRKGKYVRTFGGKGGGPGEFSGVPVIRLLPPDTVLAWDGERQRLTWFTLAGEFVRDQSLTASAAARASAVERSVTIWQLHPDGTAIGQGHTGNDHPGQGLVEDPIRLIAVRVGSGDVWATRDLPAPPEVYVEKSPVRAIFYPSVGPYDWRVRVAPPSLVVADDPNGRWMLSVYDLHGTVTGSIRTTVPRGAVTDELADSARSWLRDNARGYLSGRSLRNMLTAVARIPIPDSTPATSAIFVDARNRLWVQRWRLWWETTGVDTYDVLDRSGRWLGWVKVNRSFGRILFIGDDDILFEWKGPLGVSRVRKHRWRRVASP